VLGDGQVAEQVQFLVDEGDAARLGVARAARLVVGAGQDHPPAVHRVDAAGDVHRRRLARAVLADQPQHLAGAELEADVVQYRDAEEALADLVELQQRLSHRRTSRRWRSASITAASRMTPPLMANTENSDSPSSCRLLSMTARNSTPNRVHRILPLPPNRLTPPITAAPTTSSRMRWPSTGVPVSSRPV